jgi:hypothetical protein
MVTGSRIDLRTQSSYSFMASTSDPENRFKLSFASVGMDEVNPLGAITAWYANGFIHLANVPAEGCTLTLYTADGKRMLNTRVLSQPNPISINLSTGIYLLQMTNGKVTRNIKLSVQ